MNDQTQSPKLIATIDPSGSIHLLARTSTTRKTSRYYGCRRPLAHNSTSSSTAARIARVLNSPDYERVVEINYDLTTEIHIYTR